MAKDITYCTAQDCPFTDCIRHSNNLKNEPPDTIVTISNLGGVCRQYICYLVGDVNIRYEDDTYITDNSA